MKDRGSDMFTGKNEETFNMYQQIAAEFSSCMNDYLYAYNLQDDTYYISEQATKRFAIPNNVFHNVLETHKHFVYIEDQKILIKDLQEMIDGVKTEHNLRYRWLGLDGSPIWINCRGHRLIIPVGKWIMRNAIKMCKECQKYFPEFRISINLSYIQLLKSPVFTDIMETLNEYRLNPGSLIIELTESGHLENNNAVQNVWKKLKNSGVQIAIYPHGT